MFGYGFDRRILYIILALLVVSTISNFTTNDLLGILYTLPGVLIALTFHEFAHAFAADKLGDDTPRRQGRLTLNPIAHLDPVGSVLLLFAGIGWGKPVEINPRNFNRDITVDKANAIVSFAGPLMNFILAIIFAIGYVLTFKFAGAEFLSSQAGGILLTILTSAILTNVGLGVFNLIPLPPLDGSKILINFLPYNGKVWFENHTHIFYIIFLAIWMLGIASSIISPIILGISNGIIDLFAMIFGL